MLPKEPWKCLLANTPLQHDYNATSTVESCNNRQSAKKNARSHRRTNKAIAGYSLNLSEEEKSENTTSANLRSFEGSIPEKDDFVAVEYDGDYWSGQVISGIGKLPSEIRKDVEKPYMNSYRKMHSKIRSFYSCASKKEIRGDESDVDDSDADPDFINKHPASYKSSTKTYIILMNEEQTEKAKKKTKMWYLAY
ncbi:unnamed protein product [Acanthoscelides obtectus]|uniref:Uncharacterized protein n=1 Tax=Acanthoscelides obtectus TaxID=200917 RepID=A0A9P0LVC4_ACAOB|nr:unnamed protein product [Acanthoscelides obtectus]CAK1635345.1 hypothetical protein AOBTE_LOCUS9217 [Acanthoscelides obtectus]